MFSSVALPMLIVTASMLSPASASVSAPPYQSSTLHSVALHSIQSIPTAAFPKYPMTKLCVPYQVSFASDPCSVELSMRDSPFNLDQAMHVVPPFTGYPRSFETSSGTCSDGFDVCAQAFRVTLQVPMASSQFHWHCADSTQNLTFRCCR
jgi:hypothetical protein